MAQLILLVVSYGLYEVLTRWSKKPKEEIDERYYLPKSLQLSLVPEPVSQAYLDFRRKNRPWTSVIASLSQSRFLGAKYFDELIIRLQSFTQNYIQCKQQQRTQLSQWMYDAIEKDYKAICDNLASFRQAFISSHKTYCQYLQKRMNESDPKTDTILATRRQGNERMDQEVQYLMHFVVKMKREVDQEFLTAKYAHLYSHH